MAAAKIIKIQNMTFMLKVKFIPLIVFEYRNQSKLYLII